MKSYPNLSLLLKLGEKGSKYIGKDKTIIEVGVYAD